MIKVQWSQKRIENFEEKRITLLQLKTPKSRTLEDRISIHNYFWRSNYTKQKLTWTSKPKITEYRTSIQHYNSKNSTHHQSKTSFCTPPSLQASAFGASKFFVPDAATASVVIGEDHLVSDESGIIRNPDFG